MTSIRIEALAFFLSAFLAAGIILWIWPRRQQHDARNFIFTLFSIIIWSLAAGFEANANSLAESRFWSILSYPGILGLPLYFFFFALHYTGRGYWLTPKRRFLLAIIPIFSMLLVITNEWHHLFWSVLTPDPLRGESLIHYHHGIFYYVSTFYLYCLMVIVSFILLQAAINFRHIYRRQVIGLLIAIPLPWISNILYVLGVSPMSDKDLSPIFFSLAGVLFGYNIHQYQLLDLIPVAREKIFDHLQEGIVVLDRAGRFIDINIPAGSLLNLQSSSVIGHPAVEYLPHLKNFLEQSDARIELESSINPSRWIEINISSFTTDQDHANGRLLIIHEITHRKSLEKELERLAISDSLTGLFNRRYLESQLKSEFERSERYQTPLSLAFCDLDAFKEINDRFGHACGDKVLLQMAHLLHQCMRNSDIIARLGGDEFVIIFPQTALAEASQALERLRLQISRYPFECTAQKISISVGVTTWFPGDTTANALQRADRLLYLAKELGKDRVISDEYLKSAEENPDQLFHRFYGLD